MGTMNFSIPDDVKDAFNEAFKSENKSAIVTKMMRRALAERHEAGLRTEHDRRQRFEAAVQRLEQARTTGRTYTDDEIQRLRDEMRR